MPKPDRSEQFRRDLIEKETARMSDPQEPPPEGQDAMAGLAFEPFTITKVDSPVTREEIQQDIQKVSRIIDLTPLEKHTHEEGEACGQYFFGLLSEESDLVFVQGLIDEGMSAASVMLALIKACLAQKDVARTARFFTDESHEALQASSGRPNLKECPVCHEQYKPKRGGQMYCCSVCGVIGSGVPVEVQEHEEGCPTQEAA